MRRLKTAMTRRGEAGRKKKRGRKSKQAKAAAARRGLSSKEKAYFVFKHRHLVVKRRENLTGVERSDLTRMLEYLPELAVLRRFADRIYWLFDTPKDVHQAGCRRAAIVRDPKFASAPELVKAMEQLDRQKFPRDDGILEGPGESPRRSNNHVERTDRLFRFLEKVRSKWCRRRTLVRFVVLKLDEVWSGRTPADEEGTETRRTVRRRKSPCGDDQRPRQAA